MRRRDWQSQREEDEHRMGRTYKWFVAGLVLLGVLLGFLLSFLIWYFLV